MSLIRTIAFSTVAFIAAAGTASAGTITAKLDTGLSQGANITASGIYNGNVNTNTFSWTRTDTAGPGVDSSVPVTFDTYCVDLSQNVKDGKTFTFDVISMVDAGYTALQQSLLRNVWTAYKSSADSKNEVAALQLAIWEIVYDNDLNTATGSFKVNSSNTLKTLAQTLVTAASNLVSNPAPGFEPLNLVVLRSNTAQDQITEVPVPAPGPVALAGLGLLLAAPRRKNAR